MARRPINLAQILATLQQGFRPISGGPVGQRASAEAQLRYLPALQALLLAGQQANQQYGSDVRGVRRSGLAAAGGIDATRSGFLQQLADTQAPTSEAAAHLGLTRDAVAGELAQMQANQYAGITAGTDRLRQKHESDLAQVVQQMLNTAQQGSLYNVSQYGALSADQRKARQQARQFEAQQKAAQARIDASYRTKGLDPATGKPVPGVFDKLHPPKTGRGGKAVPGTAGAASQADYNRFTTDFAKAKRLAATADPRDSDHAVAVMILRDGVPVGVDSKGNPKLETLDNEAAVWAAIQMVRHGGISKRTYGLLHQHGLTAKRLGYKLWMPPKQSRRRGGAGSAAGAVVGRA